MTKMEKKPTKITEYSQPSFFISTVHLTFELDAHETIVKAKIHFHKNSLYTDEKPLVLNGKNLQLLEVVLDERKLQEGEYHLNEDTLTIPTSSAHFVLQTVCKISPITNTELYGLYQSNGFICSHNEPEGFRNITYFLDRPDVMAIFTTTLIAKKEDYPILLSNGNLIEEKHLPNGYHKATWEDPFKKPCYLFALVAGKLDCLKDQFITKSQRVIDLAFYTEPGKKDRAFFAMECLKKAMQFDEEVFGLEYDLNCYMIVAVDFFNMGAMENKGLNIFNTTTCFADEKTATDDNFLRVETVIGHEYFHNWSGNRIGVRDWFQLTLKEGLTVFRDQEFTCYLHDRAVKRIEDVVKLRARQFPEDQGPTAHPIQPKEYIEINNFYTPTIYDKGAEVVRMLKTLIGDEAFARGLKLFFERNDGIAATTQDFLNAMQTASQKDLKQFARWYDQYGTPVVSVTYDYTEQDRILKLNVKQTNHPNHRLLPFSPYHFPLRVGLIDLTGKSSHFYVKEARKEHNNVILEVKDHEQTFIFEEVGKESIPSINRGFSAPIILDVDFDFHDLSHLALHDEDSFNRYESMQMLTINLMQEQIVRFESNSALEVDRRLLSLIREILQDQKISDALKAKLLKLPEENELALSQEVIATSGNYEVRKFFARIIAKTFEKEFKELFMKLKSEGPYEFSSKEIGKRRLKGICLFYLAALQNYEIIKILKTEFDQAANMTDQYLALELLMQIDCEEKTVALKDFYKTYQNDSLTLIKWIVVQAASKLPNTIHSLKKLVNSPGFEIKMPNHIRALFMTLAENTSIFHDSMGEGYTFFFESMQKIDLFNPQTAALMAQSLKRIHQLDPQQKKTFKKALNELLDSYTPSANVLEILNKIKGTC